MRAVTLLVGAALPSFAQDITLTSRDGALALAGTLTSYDGEFYRLASDYGPLTIAADSVLCDGPACPDLLAPKALIRLIGDGEAGAALLPPLVAAFAQARGLDLRVPTGVVDGPTLLLQKGSETVLAEFTFTPAPPETARSAVADSRADLVVARFAPLDSSAQVLALDALIPIVAPENPVRGISTANLAAALAGEIDNWKDLGGPDMPLVVHGLDKGSDLASALAARLGQDPAPSQTHADLTALAGAVARDPWALAVTGRASAGAARPLDLVDSCGFVLDPSPLAVMAQDYPLTLPIYLLTPQRRLPLMAREFLEFLSLPPAQEAIAAQGFVARSLQTRPLAGDGARLINAIKAADGGDALAQLQRLAQLMEVANRASISFRFEAGSDDIDLTSQTLLAELAQRIAAGQLAGQRAVLVGFSAETGNGEGDYAASIALADNVLSALSQLAPDIEASLWPSIDGFGAALPMACDTTPAGERLNRRVELWLLPPLAGQGDDL
ncbi:MAG: hypothetical protein U5N55_10580 [Cypionkella sp.]|nr:hypothetical protein [Cypionkella sp.]